MSMLVSASPPANPIRSNSSGCTIANSHGAFPDWSMRKAWGNNWSDISCVIWLIHKMGNPSVKVKYFGYILDKWTKTSYLFSNVLCKFYMNLSWFSMIRIFDNYWIVGLHRIRICNICCHKNKTLYGFIARLGMCNDYIWWEHPPFANNVSAVCYIINAKRGKMQKKG